MYFKIKQTLITSYMRFPPLPQK